MDDMENQDCKNKKTNNQYNIPKNTANHTPTLLNWLKRPSITDWLILICTLVIAAAGISQCRFVKKSDETSRLRDRAFLYFANPVVKPYPEKGTPITYRNDIVLINAGSMPARRVSVVYGWKEFPKSNNIEDPWKYIDWTPAQIASVVGPKHTTVFQGRSIPLKTINAAIESKSDIFVAMEAKYLDGFDLDKVRITQMCRKPRFDAQGGSSLGFAGPHNCTDNDCPK